MGYQRPIIKLTFDDPEMAGFEARAERLTIDGMLKVSTMAELDSADWSKREAMLEELFTALADALLSWNLEDRKGNPVPLTPAGLRKQDMQFITQITGALTRASADVPAPLAPASPNGEQFQEALIPMETLSPNLLS